MSLWSQPLPPQVIGPVNSTLPIPHDPIPAQGDQPPRRQVATALAMATVLALWPSPDDQRLQRPNDQQQRIAPLTLTYGVIPAPQFPLSVYKTIQASNAWIQTWDAQTVPKSVAWNVPPSQFPHTTPPALIWTAWEPPFVKPPLPVAIAPLTLAQGQQPPLHSIVVQMETAVGAWPPDLEPRLQRPNDQRQKIAPLTLTYGQQPIPSSFLTVIEQRQIASQWPADTGPILPWPLWIREISAPLIPVPPIPALPYVQPPYGIYALCEDAARLDLVVVPTAITTPDNPSQPPRQFALNPVTQAQIGAMWVDPPPLPVRLIPSIPQPTFTPSAKPSQTILALCETLVIVPPRPVAIAPLTLTYGSQPTPTAFLSTTELRQIAETWVDPPPQPPRTIPTASTQAAQTIAAPTATATWVISGSTENLTIDTDTAIAVWTMGAPTVTGGVGIIDDAYYHVQHHSRR